MAIISLCKSCTIWVVVVACLIGFLNPVLDRWIVPSEISSEQQQNSAHVEKDDQDHTGVAIEATDVTDYTQMAFLKSTENSTGLTLGIGYFFLQQIMPAWFMHLWNQWFGNCEGFEELRQAYQARPVNIWDARKRSKELSFHESGFTLIRMKESSKTKQWRGETEIGIFQEELRPYLMQLFPTATRIEYTTNIVRGGSQLGDQPAALNALHLDYSQNDTARQEFHQLYPLTNYSKDPAYLMGHMDSDQDELGVLLGIWKPILMKTPVCDHPMVVMDARTFHPEDERPYYLHMDFGFFKLDNLNGAIVYNETQQFYYYSYQTDQEVLVFHQYSNQNRPGASLDGGSVFFANPHGSFLNPVTCPSDQYDSRVSVEMRAAVFFPKKKTGEPEPQTGTDKEGRGEDGAGVADGADPAVVS